MTIKSNEFKVLNAIHNKNGISREELLKKLRMNATTLTYTLGKLKGLIETIKAENPKGRKRHLYNLTKAGKLQLRATLELES